MTPPHEKGRVVLAARIHGKEVMSVSVSLEGREIEIFVPDPAPHPSDFDRTYVVVFPDFNGDLTANVFYNGYPVLILAPAEEDWLQWVEVNNAPQNGMHAQCVANFLRTVGEVGDDFVDHVVEHGLHATFDASEESPAYWDQGDGHALTAFADQVMDHLGYRLGADGWELKNENGGS
jgi:hypothetical protein